MKWLRDLAMQAVCSIVVICISHQIYDYVKNTCSKKVVKDMYYSQVEKYKEIVTEMQQDNDQGMENELSQFLEESISYPKE